MQAKTFGQGFGTIEYTICALVDQLLHSKAIANESSSQVIDIDGFEAAELERLGMSVGIVMRHRPTHFLHLFATEAYLANYYVYLSLGRGFGC